MFAERYNGVGVEFFFIYLVCFIIIQVKSSISRYLARYRLDEPGMHPISWMIDGYIALMVANFILFNVILN